MYFFYFWGVYGLGGKNFLNEYVCKLKKDISMWDILIIF